MLLDRGNALKRRSISVLNRRLAMKTFITALTLLLALASGVCMIAMAFRADFRQLASDNDRDRTTWELSGPNSE
jgi:hypothetical protein